MSQAAQQNYERVAREIKIKLTEQDVLSKATAAAQLNHEIGELDTELEEHKKRIKTQSTPKEEALKEHLEVIQEGFERKVVEVEVRPDYAKNLVEYYYEGQVVESRNMDSEDRQLDLVTPESAVGTRSDDEEINDVMDEEKDPDTHHDHITGTSELSDSELDPMAAQERI